MRIHRDTTLQIIINGKTVFDWSLFDFAVFSVTFYAFLASMFFMVYDLVGVRYDPPLTVQSYLYFFVKDRLPFTLPLVTCLLLRYGVPRKVLGFFSWKTWVAPCVGVALFAVAFGEAFNGVLGISWYWVAIAGYALLFLGQLYLYQRGKIDPAYAFLLSILGVFIASDLYELPTFFTSNISFYTITCIIGQVLLMALFAFLLWRAHVKPKPKLTALFLAPILVEWVVYWALFWNAPYLNRLLMLPFFLYLAYSAGTVKLLTLNTHKDKPCQTSQD